jgi:hypothetical protein
MLPLLLSTTLLVGQAPTPPPAPPERWALMEALQGTYPGWLLDGNGLRVSGWADASYTAGSAGPINLPMGFNYRSFEPLLQQAWLRFERPVNTAATTPTFGFRTDTFVGTDYRFTIARGLFDRQLTANKGDPANYGFDPVQFYGEAYLPQVGRGLDVKVGRFFAQFGAETTDAISTPLASRSYNFIYNPFTHTGVLATQKLDDAWSFQAGLATGSDVFFDSGITPTFLGSVKWAPPTGRASVLLATVVGSGRYYQANALNQPQLVDLVYTYKITDRLTYTLDALAARQDHVTHFGSVHWFAVDHYLTQTLGPRLTATARLEFFEDAQGQRTGFRGLYTAGTLGLAFKPRPWLTFRPEVRYDYNDETRPFHGQRDLATAAMETIVRW